MSVVHPVTNAVRQAPSNRQFYRMRRNTNVACYLFHPLVFSDFAEIIR